MHDVQQRRVGLRQQAIEQAWHTWDSREENLSDVWTYDVAANAWTKMDPLGPTPRGVRRECRHCAYDPSNNVVLLLSDTLWAYRYMK